MQDRSKWELRLGRSSWKLAAIRTAACVLLGTLSVQAAEKPTLLILPFDMVDTSGETPSRAQEHEDRLHALASYLSETLNEEGAYTLVDPTPIHAEIDRMRNSQALSECHGCERDLARLVHSDRVLFGEINKVSTLIGSLHLSIINVATGELVFSRVLSFRGDTDKAWQHAARFFVRDLKTIPVQRL
jgi:hypothetical protein